MDELFTLDEEDIRELLGVVKTGVFNSRRASTWSCTTPLLQSKVYKKIERAVESHLGRPVYFVFDELLTLSGDLAPDYAFQAWHKDSEDQNFDGGCWNIWIPLYSSERVVHGLEFITDSDLNEYDLVLDSTAKTSPFPIAKDQLLFVRRSDMETKLVSMSDVSIARPEAKLNHVYLLRSSRFHRGTDTDSFQIRFTVKYSVEPFHRYTGHATDIMYFAFAHNVVKKKRPHSTATELHYESGRFLHRGLSAKFNAEDVKSRVLYRSLIESLAVRGAAEYSDGIKGKQAA